MNAKLRLRQGIGRSRTRQEQQRSADAVADTVLFADPNKFASSPLFRYASLRHSLASPFSHPNDCARIRGPGSPLHTSVRPEFRGAYLIIRLKLRFLPFASPNSSLLRHCSSPPPQSLDFSFPS